MPDAPANPAVYDATSIKILGGIEAVRKRPAMYIGDTGTRGFHHLVYEVVDNSVDEALAGHCKNISVRIHEDGVCSVTDDGRGIPVDMHKEAKKSALEVVLTTLHAGGKFDHASYKVSGGLHGVGVSAVNALSEWLEVEVHRDGHAYHQRYERGAAKSPVVERGVTSRRGTRVIFKPDPAIFPERNFSYDTIAGRIRELSYLNPGVKFQIHDDRTKRADTFHSEKGLADFIAFLQTGKATLHPDVVTVEGETENVQISIAFQFNDGYAENVFSFVNTIHTHEGGTHLVGFRTAMTKAANLYAKREGILKENQDPPSGDDYREGLAAVVSARVPDPQFEGQTKTKLGNREVQGIVEALVYDRVSSYFEEHPATGRAIASKAIQAAQAREAARKARELVRKGAIRGAALPSKLADCASRDPDETEIYIVEGESAGGSAKQGRDPRVQAILPLRGKILNVEKVQIAKMLSHSEIQIIIAALGAGVGVDEFDVTKLRYGRVVIMTDADVDGSHIRTLLLTFFFRHMRPLIEQGHVFIAQPPLYRVRRKRKDEYILSDREMDQALVSLGLDGSGILSLEGGDYKALSPDLVARLLERLSRLEEVSRHLKRKGLTLEALLAARSPDGRFPQFLVREDGEPRFLYTDEELQEFAKALERTRGQPLEIFEGEDWERARDAAAGIDLMALREGETLGEALRDLKGLGFAPEALFPAAPAEGEKPTLAPYRIQYEKETVDVPSLTDLLPAIRRIGQKGMEIQRYKGLGEMNAEQLWETTMDPAKRTMLKVQLEDAAEAERLFSILMGQEVEPRRAFIEQHALEVRNLDV